MFTYGQLDKLVKYKYKKVADAKGSGEINLEYENEEGGWGSNLQEGEGGYQCTYINYFKLISTPFESAPDYFTPKEGETITEKTVQRAQNVSRESKG